MYSLFPESPDLKTRYSVKDELAQIRFENIQCVFHPRAKCLWSSVVLLGDYLLRLSNTELLLLILQRIYSVGGFCTKTNKKSRMRIYASVRICPWVPLTNNEAPNFCLFEPLCTYCWFTYTFRQTVRDELINIRSNEPDEGITGTGRWKVETSKRRKNCLMKLFNSATPTLERNPG